MVSERHDFLAQPGIYGLCAYFIVQALVGQIFTFVAKLIRLRIRAFRVLFLTQTLLRQLRFDSDFTQISEQKIDQLSPCTQDLALKFISISTGLLGMK